MSALLSALRGAGRRQVSASTIRVRQATGSHMLRINGYMKVYKIVPNGEDLKSGTFSIDGHAWHILCYPNGDGHDDKGNISLFLEHASHGRTGDATAKADMSIQPGVTAKLTHTKTTVDYRFTKKGGWGWGDFIKHDDLDKEKYLKDECFTILCDAAFLIR
jgi:speckle-type POZ protein